MNETHTHPERLGFEEWTLAGHAWEQSKDRGIPRRAIRNCIKAPESRTPAKARREKWCGRGLTCIVNPIDHTVVTVYADYRALIRPSRPVAQVVA